MRKYRYYKGVWYVPEDKEWKFRSPYGGVVGFNSAGSLIVAWPHTGLTDDDHAALMDLKAKPYEKVPTLEHVLLDWLSANNLHAEAYLGHLPNLCKRLRTAFPHIDGGAYEQSN